MYVFGAGRSFTAALKGIGFTGRNRMKAQWLKYGTFAACTNPHFDGG
jgi:hypothetical protein